MKILCGNDKAAVTDLIRSAEDDQINRNLRFLKILNIPVRRNAFKLFFSSLVEVQGSHALALIWLKANIDFDVCQKVMSDWDYKGESASFYLLEEARKLIGSVVFK